MVMLSRKAMMGSRSTGLAYQLRDEFLSVQAAPMADVLNSVPGPGKLVKATDTGDNVSITNGDLVIAAAVDDTDPAYYWTKSDGSGFTRENGLALIVYPRGGGWFGWSNSVPPTPESIVYGVKGRDGYAGGIPWLQALPYEECAHILVLTETGAQHIVRTSGQEYLAMTYPLGSDDVLWPVVMGSPTNIEAAYIYLTAPAQPVVAIDTLEVGMEFTLPTGPYIIEFDVEEKGWVGENTTVTIHKQDDDNRLSLFYQPYTEQLSLNKHVDGATSLHTRLSDTETVKTGSHVVFQVYRGGIFTTTNGYPWAKAIVDGIYLRGSSVPPFADQTAGRVEAISRDAVFRNFKIWEMNL